MSSKTNVIKVIHKGKTYAYLKFKNAYQKGTLDKLIPDDNLDIGVACIVANVTLDGVNDVVLCLTNQTDMSKELIRWVLNRAEAITTDMVVNDIQCHGVFPPFLVYGTMGGDEDATTVISTRNGSMIVEVTGATISNLFITVAPDVRTSEGIIMLHYKWAGLPKGELRKIVYDLSECSFRDLSLKIYDRTTTKYGDLEEVTYIINDINHIAYDYEKTESSSSTKFNIQVGKQYRKIIFRPVAAQDSLKPPMSNVDFQFDSLPNTIMIVCPQSIATAYTLVNTLSTLAHHGMDTQHIYFGFSSFKLDDANVREVTKKLAEVASACKNTKTIDLDTCVPMNPTHFIIDVTKQLAKTGEYHGKKK